MTRVVLLSAHPERPSTALTVDADGRILARQSLSGEAPSPPSPDAPTVLVVPGTAVRALWLELPARHPAQARAAARMLLEAHVAGDASALHVALGDAGGDPPRLLAAVEAAQLREWLARAAQLGLAPAAVVPDHLALPAAEGDVPRVFECDGDWIVRGPRLAFRAEAELAALVLGDTAGTPVSDRLALESLLAVGALRPPVDLLQGEFAPRRTAERGWRRAALLAGALLLSPLLLWTVETLRHAAATRALEAGTLARARAALPAAGDADTATAARARLAQARAGESFAPIAAALFGALRPLDGAGLDSLAYAPDGTLRATLAHRDLAQLDALRAALAAGGLALETAGTRRADDGRLRSELQISTGAPAR